MPLLSRILLFAVVLLSVTVAAVPSVESEAGRTYANPVIPGFFPDPSVVRVGEDYYLVNSTFQYFPGVIISHSRDLVNWRQIGHVFEKSEDLDLTGFMDGCGIWAPDLSWHEGKFYLFYCLVQLTKDRSINVRGNYVVTATDIHGPWSKPVQLTTEGNDPSHFVDTDGSHYLLYAGGIPKGGATRIAKLTPDCTRLAEEPRWISYGGEKRAPEGPHLIRKDGWYYHIMAASGGIYDGHHQLVGRSRSLYGPYEPSPHGPFIAQMDKTSPLQHHGHAKLVQTQTGSWWAVYLMQRRIERFSPLGRETGLDRVEWGEDGWPQLNGGRGPSARAPVPDLPPSPALIRVEETFTATTLGLPWQWVRNPLPDGSSLTERPGWLRLSTTSGDLDAPLARNIPLQREVALRATATTRMEFAPSGDQEAGLLCYYDAKSFLRLGLTRRDGLRLVLSESRKGVPSILGESPGIPAGPVELRVEIDGLSRTFAYRVGEGAWTTVGVVPKATHLSDQGTPLWGFTGTMIGLYAVGRSTGERIPAYFDDFRYRPSVP